MFCSLKSAYSLGVSSSINDALVFEVKEYDSTHFENKINSITQTEIRNVTNEFLLTCISMSSNLICLT